MKQRHLSDVTALDVALGEAHASDVDGHLAQCAECGARVAAVRDGWRLAAEATVHEPGDVFWSALRARIARRVDEDIASSRVSRLRLRAGWSLAAAVVVLVAVWVVPHTQAPPVAAVQAAWVPLDSPEEDAGLALVSEVMPAAEEDGQNWMECSGCLEGLTDAERGVVIETLRQEIGRES
jgi:hypothetical protein